jgi:hypothetical protein
MQRLQQAQALVPVVCWDAACRVASVRRCWRVQSVTHTHTTQPVDMGGVGQRAGCVGHGRRVVLNVGRRHTRCSAAHSEPGAVLYASGQQLAAGSSSCCCACLAAEWCWCTSVSHSLGVWRVVGLGISPPPVKRGLLTSEKKTIIMQWTSESAGAEKTRVFGGGLWGSSGALWLLLWCSDVRGCGGDA